MEVHKQFHANYAKKLRDIVSAIPADGPKMVDLIHINQHIGVLISHIRSTDKKLEHLSILRSSTTKKRHIGNFWCVPFFILNLMSGMIFIWSMALIKALETSLVKYSCKRKAL